MVARCENCGQTKELPSYLWRRVVYNNVSKTVCPACYEWAKIHPEKAKEGYG